MNGKIKTLKKSNSKRENGIKLIALVITIIVLLILAGVSIAMLTGNNGILTQANNAKNDTIIGEEKEQIQLAYSSAKMKKLKDNGTTDVTKEELDAEFKTQKFEATVTQGENSLVVTVASTNNVYSLNTKTGDVTKSLDVTKEQTLAELVQTGAIKAGDKIEYNPRTTYDKGWNVIYINDNTVDIISRDVIGQTVTIKGRSGHDDFIRTLNQNAGYYLNTDCAIAARSVGTTIQKDKSIYISGLGTQRIYYEDLDEKDLQTINELNLSCTTPYWYAQRDIRENTQNNQKSVALDCRFIKYNNNKSSITTTTVCVYTTRVSTNEMQGSYNIRPIITLRSDIKLKKDNDTWKIIQ